MFSARSNFWRSLPQTLLLAGTLATSTHSHAKTCSVDRTPLNEAEIAELRGETSRAIKLFRELSARDPAQLKWQQRIIEVELSDDKVDTAWTEAQRLLAASPNSPDALLAVSLVGLRRGNFDLAMSSIQTALRTDPCDARILTQLGKLQAWQGHHLLAVRSLDLAHRLAPIDAYLQFAWVRSRRRKEQREAFTSMLSSTSAFTDEQKRNINWQANAAAFEASSMCTVLPASSTVVVPFFQLDQNHIRPTDVPGISASINGHTEELELGAFGDDPIVVTHALADSLGLKHDTESFTPHGGLTTYYTHLDRIRIGDVEYRNCPALVVDETFDVHLHGRISVAFFRDFSVTVDLAKRQLKLETLPLVEAAGDPASWSNAKMGGPEVPSVIAGDWPPNEPAIPVEKRNWMHAYNGGGNILVPVSLGPNTERLFLLNYMRSATVVLPSTAREAVPVATDTSLSPREKAALHNAHYSLRTGEVILGIEHWNEITDLPVAGSLGEDMRNMRVTVDLRDTLVKVEPSFR